MSRILFAGFTAAFTVMLMITALQAQPSEAPKAGTEKEQIAQLQQQSQEAYETEKWVAFYIANMKLAKLRPFESEYLVNIVKACALLDRKSTAYHYMLQMQQQGMTYDFNSTEDTLLIRNTEAYEYINDLLVAAAQAAGSGSSAFKLPGKPADFRAITWDGSRNRFLVGTMSEGTVLAVAANGETEVLLEANDENGLWSISGLAVDTERNRLWVSSAATPLFSGFSPVDKNRGSLFEFNLKTLEQVSRYNLPVDGLRHEAGSVAVTEDGLVYLIDREVPIVYLKKPDSDRLEAFFASVELRALRDIAVAPDNSRIFIVDAAKGILAIDPIAQQAALMTGPETMNLGGIHGIAYRDGEVFVVQGGFEPQRVIRLELDPSGTVAVSISPMAIALDDFSQPGVATMHGNSLYYFANSGADDADSLVVMNTPLDVGVAVAPPDMAEFEQALRARQQQQPKE